jgi:zona occludens toxin (predicted ATPase)
VKIPELQKENAMAEKEKQESEPVSKWQAVFDNIWLLFLLSLLISTLIYNVWGIADLLSVPPAP